MTEWPGGPVRAAPPRQRDRPGQASVPQEAHVPHDDGVPLQRSLPGRSYTSEAEFARERDRVLLPGWFCVGRADGLTEPGCYLAADVCGESIIVTRTDGGGLAGHYNLCRHRGSRLVPQPTGREYAGPPAMGRPAAGPAPGEPESAAGSPVPGPPAAGSPDAGP